MPQFIKFKYVFALAFGSLIYLFFRNSSLKMFLWLNYFGLGKIIASVRNFTLPFVSSFPDWFLFSLPDGLWIFSFISLQLHIWKYSLNFSNLIWFVSIPLIAIISEIFQNLNILNGVFDPFDILFYSLGFILPFILNTRILNFNFQIS